MNHPRALNLHGVPHKVQPAEAAAEYIIGFKFHQKRAQSTAALVRDLDLLTDTLNDIRAEIVEAMREDGASWSEVGEMFGMTRQGARQRFGGQGIA